MAPFSHCNQVWRTLMEGVAEACCWCNHKPKWLTDCHALQKTKSLQNTSRILNKHPISTKHSVQKSCIYHLLFLDQTFTSTKHPNLTILKTLRGTKTSGSTLFTMYPTSNFYTFTLVKKLFVLTLTHPVW